MERRTPDLGDYSSVELVEIAVARNDTFKDVCDHLRKRMPDPEAARLLIWKFEQDEVRPWLTAVLLGSIGDESGYATAFKILHLGAGSLSESYAGTAMTKIAGVRATADLVEAMGNGRTVKIREGAAYGLANMGSVEAVHALLEAGMKQRIPIGTAGSLLGRLSFQEQRLIDLLRSGNELHVRLGAAVMEGMEMHHGEAWFVDHSYRETFASGAMREAVRDVLANSQIRMSPKKRARVREWLERQEGYAQRTADERRNP